MKAAGAASTVLSNMFQYNKLHRDYKQVRLGRRNKHTHTHTHHTPGSRLVVLQLLIVCWPVKITTDDAV